MAIELNLTILCFESNLPVRSIASHCSKSYSGNKKVAVNRNPQPSGPLSGESAQ